MAQIHAFIQENLGDANLTPDAIAAATWLAAHSISSIAARRGFTSPQHFSQAFRRAYGLSPRQCRRQRATVRGD